MSFPTAQPSYPDTQGNETLATAGGGVGLSGILDVYGVDLAAACAKIGTGSSTPVADSILAGTGTGVSTWKTSGVSIASLYINNGIMDFEGASGNMRFNANPDGGEYNIGVSATGTLALFGASTNTLSLKMLDGTIYTDTIGETTAANGVTIDGLNIKDGALNTANSVGASALDGIDKSLLTTDSNPYKFSVYRNAALTPGTADIVFDTENYDTNNNHDTSTGRYTAPVDGYYQLNAQIALTTTGANLGYGCDIKKNGTVIASWRAVMMYAGAYTHTATISTLAYATAGQYFTVAEGASSGKAVVVGAANTYFNGFLVSRT